MSHINTQHNASMLRHRCSHSLVERKQQLQCGLRCQPRRVSRPSPVSHSRWCFHAAHFIGRWIMGARSSGLLCAEWRRLGTSTIVACCRSYDVLCPGCPLQHQRSRKQRWLVFAGLHRRRQNQAYLFCSAFLHPRMPPYLSHSQAANTVDGFL